MNHKVWCKTILTVYKFLGTVATSLDKCIKRMACSAGIETENQAEKIISYTENKICLINLKVLTEQILLCLPKECAEILMLRYFDGMQNDDIANLKNLGMRTYFRKLNKAMIAFEKEMEEVLPQHKKLFDELIKQRWIEVVFEEQLDKINNKVSVEGSGMLEKLINCPMF